jgi:hypothetical protein
VLFAAMFIAVQMLEAWVTVIPELRYGDFDKLLEILYVATFSLFWISIFQ